MRHVLVFSEQNAVACVRDNEKDLCKLLAPPSRLLWEMLQLRHISAMVSQVYRLFVKEAPIPHYYPVMISDR